LRNAGWQVIDILENELVRETSHRFGSVVEILQSQGEEEEMVVGGQHVLAVRAASLFSL